ncbi:hypothetical protein Hanom_Chr07g00631051 [Helianthus anomalus]
MSELPPNVVLQKELRIDYLDIIMRDKPNKAYRSHFKDWSFEDLKKEVNRIEMMNKDPKMKKSAPNWNKHKKVDVDEALRYKRKRAELVAANYGTARSIARWSKQDVYQTYKRLEELRKTNPTLPKKPVYDAETTNRPQQTHSSKKLFSSSDVSISVLNQRKRQQLIDEEDEKRDVEFRKEAIKNQLQFRLDDVSL